MKFMDNYIVIACMLINLKKSFDFSQYIAELNNETMTFYFHPIASRISIKCEICNRFCVRMRNRKTKRKKCE